MNILKMKKKEDISVLILDTTKSFCSTSGKNSNGDRSGYKFSAYDYTYTTRRYSPMVEHERAQYCTTSANNLIPDKQESWDSPIGDNYEKAFTHEGIYLYKCKPHSNLSVQASLSLAIHRLTLEYLELLINRLP